MNASALTFGNWTFFGGLTFIDLIAATINALNGALLARRPDRYKNCTFIASKNSIRSLTMADRATRTEVVLPLPPSTAPAARWHRWGHRRDSPNATSAAQSFR